MAPSRDLHLVSCGLPRSSNQCCGRGGLGSEASACVQQRPPLRAHGWGCGFLRRDYHCRGGRSYGVVSWGDPLRSGCNPLYREEVIDSGKVEKGWYSVCMWRCSPADESAGYWWAEALLFAVSVGWRVAS